MTHPLFQMSPNWFRGIWTLDPYLRWALVFDLLWSISVLSEFQWLCGKGNRYWWIWLKTLAMDIVINVWETMHIDETPLPIIYKPKHPKKWEYKGTKWKDPCPRKQKNHLRGWTTRRTSSSQTPSYHEKHGVVGLFLWSSNLPPCKMEMTPYT